MARWRVAAMCLGGLLVLAVGCSATSPTPTEPEPLTLRVVSFNSGTTPGLPHESPPDQGYGDAEAALSDTWYGDGLAWEPAIAASADWLAAERPDLIGLQEIFDPAGCADIPESAWPGFVCAGHSPGGPSVARLILGSDYQIACHPGRDDKCVAVHRGFGLFVGCDTDDCPTALEGGPVEGCGSGARVAAGDIQRPDGSRLRVVHLHGSSGLDPEERACRVAQFEQAFALAGTEDPTVLLGDLNTDPGRFAAVDPSAALWAEGDGRFLTHTPFGEAGPGSYQGLADIDHIATDFADGACWHAGLEDGPSAVFPAEVYFDHRPVGCDLTAITTE